MEKESNQKNVLVVEDSPIQAELLRRFIVSKGFNCKIAADGGAGLLSIQETRPDIIISDIQMPVLDGYQMCEQIKKIPSPSLYPLFY